MVFQICFAILFSYLSQQSGMHTNNDILPRHKAPRLLDVAGQQCGIITRQALPQTELGPVIGQAFEPSPSLDP